MFWQLISNLLIIYGIIIVVNIPAPFLGLVFQNESAEQRLWFEPPGWIIPIVWFVLFTLMGAARYILTKGENDQFDRYAIIILAIFCATYAYYTLGLSQLTGISPLWFGLWGNVAVVVATVLVCWFTLSRSFLATVFIAPVILWTVFATFIVVGKMKAQGLI